MVVVSDGLSGSTRTRLPLQLTLGLLERGICGDREATLGGPLRSPVTPVGGPSWPRPPPAPPPTPHPRGATLPAFTTSGGRARGRGARAMPDDGVVILRFHALGRRACSLLLAYRQTDRRILTRCTETPMRIALPIVLLLFGASSAYGQAQTSASAAESTVPAPAQAPVQPRPATSPAPAVPEESNRDQPSARAEAATAAEKVEAQEPKKRSRVVWFLVGAVVVLGVVLAATL